MIVHWTGLSGFTEEYLALMLMLLLRCRAEEGEGRGVQGSPGESSAPKEKWWGSIFDTSFTVWGSGGGGGGGGESFTRLTLSCLQSDGRYRGDRTDQALLSSHRWSVCSHLGAEAQN